MMAKALILGISGGTGRAIARALLDAGWEVVGTGRCRDRFPEELAAAGAEFIESDRHDPDQLARVLAGGADVVVDCVCYTAEQASWLVAAADDIGSVVLLSSKAVYVDALGRHSGSLPPPDFGGPVDESQAVLAPDTSGDYDSAHGYGPNKVAAELTLLNSALPVSVLRPSRIHGVGMDRPREWFFVRRLLDGRTAVPLAHDGLTANHPTAAVNLAALVAFCAAAPGTQVLNAADPGAPTAADIATAIAAAMGVELNVVRLPTDGSAELGRNPWDTWPSFLLNCAAAERLGFRPVGAYAQTVRDDVRWLRGLDPEQQDRLTADPYFEGRFDYTAEDRLLAQLAR